MDVITHRAIEYLLLPPGGPILLGFLGLLYWRFGYGRRVFVFALLLLWVTSLPITADLLAQGLEIHPALSEERLAESHPEAIIVLGGGRNLDAPEYGGDTVSARELERLRYAAKLARQTGLPVIPSGGAPIYFGEPEAKIAARILQDEFGVSVSQIEAASNTTWDNARLSAQLLKKLGIKQVLLVTNALHMRRAIYAFERNGVEVIAAPTSFIHKTNTRHVWLEGLPNGLAVKNVAYAMHEYVGLLWYYFK
ncbi:YdcF family protein [Candidatus Endoriftia persephone]|jgi:uncharacterized SAM-binding protein YcdF (DUF218 family)|uniref:DUF218 domain-containing protein n=3 Tax=Gammaproteobacteria TaxID=1236 RepID=G2FG45_9GAMM|nr:YdcF family protein [Candidatus Endoriftia persephone]EGV51103.1 protein of unknown function DUF218 [endosymbiont of Riftia pachyptila (vent Ph05)]EGW54278.1 hypothetical protein TevJSym_ao00640 [endosymbiont of Tevnia jerichonana (vent Tica)]USF87423.1 YdcF family protein [Candidatus Endoriftia persephone]